MKRGLELLGHEVMEVNWFDPTDINNRSLYYGNVGFTRAVMRELGYSGNWIGHVPEDLFPLAGRSITVSPLKDALRLGRFIKPMPENGKSFNGFVYSKQSDLLNVANVDMHAKVISSDAVTFVSEWRCFVQEGEVLDAKHYKGNFRTNPDYGVADSATRLWRDAPAAYSCDLGVTDDGRTLVVECNDVMSLGLYGVSPLIAASMLEKRWGQIHRNRSL